ncbi:hypothetical protein FVE85_8863 [Porphyridium purpureum]|uniref:Uncharacterized protein n=1 Tax=Porphyridium purpureum TaxID=35688 RepID=A0A5J4YQ42_PORPP|nr:hypothetical protein FVE85_8863 [Porphyridium purpureum]|eukprot:POR5905..scf296_7
MVRVVGLVMVALALAGVVSAAVMPLARMGVARTEDPISRAIEGYKIAVAVHAGEEVAVRYVRTAIGATPGITTPVVERAELACAAGGKHECLVRVPGMSAIMERRLCCTAGGGSVSDQVEIVMDGTVVESHTIDLACPRSGVQVIPASDAFMDEVERQDGSSRSSSSSSSSLSSSSSSSSSSSFLTGSGSSGILESGAPTLYLIRTLISLVNIMPTEVNDQGGAFAFALAEGLRNLGFSDFTYNDVRAPSIDQRMLGSSFNAAHQANEVSLAIYEAFTPNQSNANAIASMVWNDRQAERDGAGILLANTSAMMVFGNEVYANGTLALVEAQTPAPTPAPSQTPSASPSPSSTASPAPTPVCIDADWIEARGLAKVHASDGVGELLCIAGLDELPCGTPDHVLEIAAGLRTYAEVCAERECARKVGRYNGVLHSDAHLMPEQDGHRLTTVAHRGTWWSGMENRLVVAAQKLKSRHVNHALEFLQRKNSVALLSREQT